MYIVLGQQVFSGDVELDLNVHPRIREDPSERLPILAGAATLP